MDGKCALEDLVERLWEAKLTGKPGHRGDRRHVRMWARHKGACGYCGAYLLEDVVGFCSAQLDHLLPQAKYPHLRDVEENWVLACFVCNQFKRDFDPLEGRSAIGITAENFGDHRGALIARCVDHLRPRREERDALRVQVVQILPRRAGQAASVPLEPAQHPSGGHRRPSRSI